MERLPLQKRLGLGAILVGLAILVFMFVFNKSGSPLQSGGGTIKMPDIVEPIKETVGEVIEEVATSVISGGGRTFIQSGGGKISQSFFDDPGLFQTILGEFSNLGFSS